MRYLYCPECGEYLGVSGSLYCYFCPWVSNEGEE